MKTWGNKFGVAPDGQKSVFFKSLSRLVMKKVSFPPWAKYGQLANFAIKTNLKSKSSRASGRKLSAFEKDLESTRMTIKELQSSQGINTKPILDRLVVV